MEAFKSSDLSSNQTDCLNSLSEKCAAQQSTSELRLDFLNILSKLEGKNVNLNLYKRSTASSGVFQGSDRDILHFAVSNFQSPTGVIKSAVLRTTDIDCMSISVDLPTKQ